MKTNSSFSERLLQIFTDFSVTSTQFADQIGVQKSTLSHLLSNRNKPSLDLLLKIIEHFPTLNLYWLADGRSPMYIDNQETLSTFSPTRDEKQSEVDIHPEEIIQTTSEDELSSKKVLQDVSDESEIDYIVIFYKNGTFKKYKTI